MLLTTTVKKTSQNTQKLFLCLTIIALVFSIIFLIAFGFIGVGRGNSAYASNVSYFYAAGKVWLAEESPYIFDIFREVALSSTPLDPKSYFAYPPTISLFSILLALLPSATVEVIIGLLNILALLVLCWASLAIAFKDQAIHWFSPQFFLLSAIIIGNPLTAHVVWLGQTSLIVTAATCLAFIWAGRGHCIFAGMMLGIASIKPQLSLLIGFWLLLEKRYTVIAVATIIACITSLPAMLISGFSVITEWLNALQSYQGGRHDVISFRHVFGLRSLLSDFGIILPPLTPIAFIGFGCLFWKRSHFDRNDILPLLIVLSLIFIYAHDYDIATSFIAAGSFFWLLRDRPVAGIIALAMLAYICIPQRLVLHLIPGAGHYREPIYFILAAWLLWLMIKFQKIESTKEKSTT